MAYNPIRNAFESDFVLLGGKLTPGIAVVEGLSRKSKWDVKDGQGQKGAKVTYVGESPSKFRIKFTLWSDVQFILWDKNIKPVLSLSRNPPHPAIDIWHPDCVDVGVKSVIVEDVTKFVENGDGWDCTVSFIEFTEPKPDFGTSKGAVASAVGNAKTKEDKTNPLIVQQNNEIQFKKAELERRRAAGRT